MIPHCGVKLTIVTAIVAANKALCLVTDWCRRHAMVLHPKKSEAMLISRQKFVGLVQALTINGTSINLVSSTRCLDVVLDDQISWTPHLKETIKMFARKLNLLRSL